MWRYIFYNFNISSLQMEIIVFLSMQTYPIQSKTITKLGKKQVIIMSLAMQLQNFGLIDAEVNGIVLVGVKGSINKRITLSNIKKS